MKRTTLTIPAVVSWLILASAAAEGAGAGDALTELAKQDQNPLARIVRLQLEDNASSALVPTTSS